MVSSAPNRRKRIPRCARDDETEGECRCLFLRGSINRTTFYEAPMNRGLPVPGEHTHPDSARGSTAAAHLRTRSLPTLLQQKLCGRRPRHHNDRQLPIAQGVSRIRNAALHRAVLDVRRYPHQDSLRMGEEFPRALLLLSQDADPELAALAKVDAFRQVINASQRRVADVAIPNKKRWRSCRARRRR